MENIGEEEQGKDGRGESQRSPQDLKFRIKRIRGGGKTDMSFQRMQARLKAIEGAIEGVVRHENALNGA